MNSGEPRPSRAIPRRALALLTAPVVSFLRRSLPVRPRCRVSIAPRNRLPSSRPLWGLCPGAYAHICPAGLGLLGTHKLSTETDALWMRLANAFRLNFEDDAGSLVSGNKCSRQSSE